MTDKSFTCRGCGCQFTGRKRIYCTKQCRSKTYSYNLYRSQGRKTREEISANAACNQMYDCLACGKLFKPKRAGHTKFCSRNCSFSFISAKRKIIADMNIVHSVYRMKCCECSIRSNGYVGQKYCSDDCRRKKLEKSHTQKTFACKECSCNVVTSYGTKRKSFCSDVCSKKYFNRIRRSKERARLRHVKVEHVDPIKVFERDAWRCKICYKKTPKEYRGSIRDLAPELDHILPLSKGGEHSYANTQCTCRKCNQMKGNAIYGQIPLFSTA